MKKGKTSLALKDAVLVKSAEMWLRFGEPLQALLELRRLGRRACKHPWTETVFRRAAQAVG